MSTDSGGAPAPPVSELNKTFWKDEFVHDKMASGVPMDQDTIEVENIGSQVEVRSMETLDTEEGIHSERINIQTEEPKALTIIEDEPFYYTGQDQTPYQVYVESIDKNIGQLRDMAFGSLLMKAKVEGVKVIERRGRNRLAVEFSSMTAANLFLKSSFIKNNELRAFTPRHLISCKGIIRRIDPNLSDEFILENIKTSTGRDVLQVKRMKRKKDSEDSTEIEYVNTASVIVTFRGKSLPNYIFFFFCRWKSLMDTVCLDLSHTVVWDSQSDLDNSLGGVQREGCGDLSRKCGSESNTWKEHGCGECNRDGKD
ncbi:hypothetical protein MML48_3g00020628 [Holotrichia oblita]|uniref:Uncharacterized protein n=1 Tax=Holotrichia oblita TaxID=644536 RepID=A0ACB9TE55_HOLOL|nr:hypothetical protein MML48_3g00020628 [Holotrichia oblita]